MAPPRNQHEPPPTSAFEALERAGAHARQAGVELTAAARALVDAISLGWSGQPSEANAVLATLSASLDELADRLGRGATQLPEPIARVVLSALDDEIARWEKRSVEDAEARGVLRAFLGIREILWELGVRQDNAPEPGNGAAADVARSDGKGDRTERAARSSGTRSNSAGSDKPRTRRLSRVKVQG